MHATYHCDCERGGRFGHIVHELVQSEEGGLRGFRASRQLIDLDLVGLDHSADGLKLRGRLAGLELCAANGRGFDGSTGVMNVSVQ